MFRSLTITILLSLNGCGSLVQVVDAGGVPLAGAEVAPVHDSHIGPWTVTDSSGFARLHLRWFGGLRMVLVNTATGERWKWTLTGSLPDVLHLDPNSGATRLDELSKGRRTADR